MNGIYSCCILRSHIYQVYDLFMHMLKKSEGVKTIFVAQLCCEYILRKPKYTHIFYINFCLAENLGL